MILPWLNVTDNESVWPNLRPWEDYLMDECHLDNELVWCDLSPHKFGSHWPISRGPVILLTISVSLMNIILWNNETCDAVIDLKCPIYYGLVILPYAPLQSSDFVCILLLSKTFSFIGKTQFRRATLSWDLTTSDFYLISLRTIQNLTNDHTDTQLVKLKIFMTTQGFSRTAW